jgi:hypothetical protein
MSMMQTAAAFTTRRTVRAEHAPSDAVENIFADAFAAVPARTMPRGVTREELVDLFPELLGRAGIAARAADPLTALRGKARAGRLLALAAATPSAEARPEPLRLS